MIAEGLFLRGILQFEGFRIWADVGSKNTDGKLCCVSNAGLLMIDSPTSRPLKGVGLALERNMQSVGGGFGHQRTPSKKVCFNKKSRPTRNRGAKIRLYIIPKRDRFFFENCKWTRGCDCNGLQRSLNRQLLLPSCRLSGSNG